MKNVRWVYEMRHRIDRCVLRATFVLTGHDVSVFVLCAGDIEVAV